MYNQIVRLALPPRAREIPWSAPPGAPAASSHRAARLGRGTRERHRAPLPGAKAYHSAEGAPLSQRTTTSAAQLDGVSAVHRYEARAHNPDQTRPNIVALETRETEQRPSCDGERPWPSNPTVARRRRGLLPLPHRDSGGGVGPAAGVTVETRFKARLRRGACPTLGPGGSTRSNAKEWVRANVPLAWLLDRPWSSVHGIVPLRLAATSVRFVGFD